MSEPTKPNVVPWYRRIKPWQFSLRSLLVLMAIASAGCWYYLRPKRHEEKLADGHLILQRQYRGKGETAGGGLGSGFQGYNDGYWRLSDFRGRLLTSGNYSKGKETGWWSSYHLNGHLATRGKMRSGERIGVWKTWSPDGQLLSELTFGPATSAALPLPRVQTSLNGPARFWHANGKLAAAGEFQENERTGRWEEWNERGEITAVGNYWDGRKDGAWREFSTDEKKLVERQYVQGHLKEVLDRHLLMLSERIEQGDLTQRLTLLSVLAELGQPAVPLLEKVTASAKTPQEQMAAIAGLARCGGKLETWLKTMQAIEAGPEPQLAAGARWEIFRAFPAERAKLLTKSLNDAEQLAESSWPDAFARLREMFEIAPDYRAEIFPVVLRVSPEQTIFAHVHGWPVLTDGEAASIIASWHVDVVPYLDDALSDPDPKNRMTAVILIRHLLSEQNEPFRFFPTNPGTSYPEQRWRIPANLQPLVDKARRDSDPKIKERADELDKLKFGPPYGGAGGMGGGGGLF